MVSQQRRAPSNSEMRLKLIAAAAAIIREKGYSALTSRTLADRLKLKRQILHYYFDSMDDLLIQLVRESHDRTVAGFLQAAREKNPLQALWNISLDPRFAVLSLELAALAARRPSVREAVRESAEQLRALQVQISASILPGVTCSPCSTWSSRRY